MAKTDSIKTDFYINYLTQAQFDALTTKEADQIYLTPDASITQITAGDGLSGGGTSGIINLSHSNSVSAKSALALYPITFDAQGHITNSGNAITVPTITLNGSSTTSPSFYAPTSAGTSGYFLKSNGTGAPTWVSKPTYTASEVGALPSNHTYTTSIAESTGTNQITLSYGKKYSLTAGGTSYVFTMPADNNTTYSAGTGLSLSGTTFNVKLGYSTSGNNRAVQADSNGNLYVVQTDTDTNTHNTAYLYAGVSNGSANAQTTNGNTYLILVDGGSATSRRKISGSTNISVTSDASGNITITGPDLSSYAKTSQIPTVPSNIVNTITTSAGAHTSISSKTGNVSFNIPTKTSHLTNDSGFLTSHQDISGKADKTGVVEFLGNLTSLGSNTPAAATQTYWIDNIANNTVKAAYNTSGNEYTIFFSRGGSSNYGSILKWGYNDLYFYIVRRNGSSWRETDWVKMNAGYADSAGSVAWSNVSGAPTIPTKTSQLTNDSGFLTSHQTAVTSLTTTAGSHSTKSSATGAVSMAVPTKTSHLTNDSDFTTLQAVYPVGAIYISTVSTDPKTLFGFGTWDPIEGQFLLGANSTYTAGSTGGSPDAVVVSHTHGPKTGNYYLNTFNVHKAGTCGELSGTTRHYMYQDTASSNSYWSSNTTTGSAGESGSGKNMPPYLAVYMWKRTA